MKTTMEITHIYAALVENRPYWSCVKCTIADLLICQTKLSCVAVWYCGGDGHVDRVMLSLFLVLGFMTYYIVK